MRSLAEDVRQSVVPLAIRPSESPRTNATVFRTNWKDENTPCKGRDVARFKVYDDKDKRYCIMTKLIKATVMFIQFNKLVLATKDYTLGLISRNTIVL